jgi:hypothetical protein
MKHSSEERKIRLDGEELTLEEIKPNVKENYRLGLNIERRRKKSMEEIIWRFDQRSQQTG